MSNFPSLKDVGFGTLTAASSLILLFWLVSMVPSVAFSGMFLFIGGAPGLSPLSGEDQIFGFVFAMIGLAFTIGMGLFWWWSFKKLKKTPRPAFSFVLGLLPGVAIAAAFYFLISLAVLGSLSIGLDSEDAGLDGADYSEEYEY